MIFRTRQPAPRTRLAGIARALLASAAVLSCGGGPTDGGATPALMIQVSGNFQEAEVSTTAPDPLVVAVMDAEGQPIEGRQVAWAVVQGSGTVSPATSRTDAAGQASTVVTLGATPGTVLVQATLGALPPVPFVVTAAPSDSGVPHHLVVVSGGSQTGTVNESLPTALVVRLVDADDRPVAGGTVQFTPSTGGQATPTLATTNVNGEATATWRLATTAGAQTMSVASAGVETISMSATAQPGPAAELAIVSGNAQTGVTGRTLPDSLVVRVTDAWDNAIAGASVGFSVTAGGGAIAPASVTTDATGTARAAWTLGPALGANAAVATVAGLSSAAITATGTPPIEALPFRIVDAEYNAATGKIVAVSADPSRLHVIDPESGDIATVSLAQVPAAVAVQPDGQFAAVGHNAWISYVALAAMAVDTVYSVTADVIDIVLPGNGYVYAFPRIDQWETIRTIDLATGTETTSAGSSIRAGTLVRLHPSGDYIYGANNGLSPSDFEKYDIRSGTANVMYDSPYHGDYAFNGNIWISEDGLRLFARSGNVFRSSAVKEQDMLYAGKLEGMSTVEWVTESTAASLVFALPGESWDAPAPSELRLYGRDYLAFRAATPLPRFEVPGVGAFRSTGRFVFTTTDGTKAYVLVQADPESGLAQDWGWVVYPVDQLP